MDQAFAKELSTRSLLKAKGYSFNAKNQYWEREWLTNNGKERVLEIALKTEDNQWNKLMMTSSGKVFYAECIGEEIK
tara:strand:+ start:333 stop:563 length:231 start_codon:yes stop_codon:yes gene_type:complete